MHLRRHHTSSGGSKMSRLMSEAGGEGCTSGGMYMAETGSSTGDRNCWPAAGCTSKETEERRLLALDILRARAPLGLLLPSAAATQPALPKSPTGRFCFSLCSFIPLRFEMDAI
jgi:hypothetical protein